MRNQRTSPEDVAQNHVSPSHSLDNQPAEEPQGYEGWHNYQTWAVALWLDNDPGSYVYVRELARDAYEFASETTYATRGQAAAWSLAETLRDDHEDGAETWHVDGPASVFSDLLASALGLVDFHEIAHVLVTEVLSEMVA